MKSSTFMPTSVYIWYSKALIMDMVYKQFVVSKGDLKYIDV